MARPAILLRRLVKTDRSTRPSASALLDKAREGRIELLSLLAFRTWIFFPSAARRGLLTSGRRSRWLDDSAAKLLALGCSLRVPALRRQSADSTLTP